MRRQLCSSAGCALSRHGADPLDPAIASRLAPVHGRLSFGHLDDLGRSVHDASSRDLLPARLREIRGPSYCYLSSLANDLLLCARSLYFSSRPFDDFVHLGCAQPTALVAVAHREEGFDSGRPPARGDY